ncbi:restriction endonuclease [Streptococcus mutans]|uniref:restriction endonuclease n=2 Tax=Streptococcus mutans TaxID=1309 RepID=UPI001BDE0DA6|nr:restriction endonuclease [Streptococcus mutans]
MIITILGAITILLFLFLFLNQKEKETQLSNEIEDYQQKNSQLKQQLKNLQYNQEQSQNNKSESLKFSKIIPLQKNLTIDSLRLKNFRPSKDYQDDQHFFEDFLLDPNQRLDSPYATGKRFEYFISSLYRLAGYKAEITPINDKGVDVIVTDKQGEKLLIQCKNYSITNYFPSLVGDAEVRKLNGTPLQGKKMFITTSFFTGHVKKEDYPDITFVDRRSLFVLIQQLVPEFYSEYLFNLELHDNILEKCNRCWKGIMINKKNKYGQAFRTCSNYPNCEHTEKVKINQY